MATFRKGRQGAELVMSYALTSVLGAVLLCLCTTYPYVNRVPAGATCGVGAVNCGTPASAEPNEKDYSQLPHWNEGLVLPDLVI